MVDYLQGNEKRLNYTHPGLPKVAGYENKATNERLFSVAHFCRFLVIDRLKSQKTNCSNPPQDLSRIKVQFWWPSVPLFLWCCRQACDYFPTRFKPQFSAKDRCVDQCIRTTESPCFGWSKVAMYSEYMVKAHYALWTDCSTFPVLFTTTDFVFRKSGILFFSFFLTIVTPCATKSMSPRHLVL